MAMYDIFILAEVGFRYVTKVIIMLNIAIAMCVVKIISTIIPDKNYRTKESIEIIKENINRTNSEDLKTDFAHLSLSFAL